VPAGQVRTAALFVMAPTRSFVGGERAVRFQISDGASFRARVDYELVGPERERGEDHERDER